MGWVSEETVLPWWVYATAVVGLGVAMWIIWSVRTPYPDLKKKRPEEYG